MLLPDEGVAKTIMDMKTTDPVAHDVKYSSWTNRYSDFAPEWRKKKNPDTGEMEGHLVAVGRPRLNNLGDIGKGSIFYIMQGSMQNQPLPSITVGDVRLNHLQFQINFTTAITFREGTTNSNDFMVGHDNALYGLPERNQLKKTFIEKKQNKVQPVTDMLADLLKNINIAVKKATNGVEEVDTDQEEDDKRNHNQATPHSNYQLNGGRNDEDDKAWQDYQARSHSHPSYLQRFQTTKDREAAMRLAKQFVAPAPIFTELNVLLWFIIMFSYKWFKSFFFYS